MVAPPPEAAPVNDEALDAFFLREALAHHSVKEAAREAHEHFGVARKRAYARRRLVIKG